MYEKEISLVRRKLVFDENPPLGEMLDIDGDGNLSLRDLWLWKRESSRFRIQVNFTGGSPDDHEIVKMAAERWEQIIVGKTSTSEYDVTMQITFDSNLADNILGQAGVLQYAHVGGKYIPTRGLMILSTKNWEQQKAAKKMDGLSNAYYTVLHEMGHILGIGTMWHVNKLLNSDGQYIGPAALREYRRVCGNDNIPFLPIEDDGGGGTAGYHPEEGLEPNVSLDDRVGYKDGQKHSLPGLDKELMTGWAEVDAEIEPLSAISVGMLEDIGYEVNYAYADGFEMYDVNGNQIQNKKEGFAESGERVYVTFVDNGQLFSTYVNGYDYMNRITFNLYVASLERYLSPTEVRLRVVGGNGVKVSKLVYTPVGTSIGVHILGGSTNVIKDEEVAFTIPPHKNGASRFSIVFTG